MISLTKTEYIYIYIYSQLTIQKSLIKFNDIQVIINLQMRNMKNPSITKLGPLKGLGKEEVQGLKIGLELNQMTS